LQIPGKIIKFQKKINKPVLRAYINAEIYIGDDQLDALATIKSKEELIGKSLDCFNHHKVISALQNQFAESDEATSRNIIKDTLILF
jgi:large subunit ribosomal protein L10